MNRIQCLLSTSLLGCAIIVQPAFAQDAAAQTASSASDQPSNDGQELQDIIVTAERRTSTAQKTAASVSVRSGEYMLLQGRYELKDILEDVPGVVGGAATGTNSSKTSGTDNPAAGLIIRGVQSNSGSGTSITSTASTAAIYVDGVYNGIGGNYDIDRVEVLRGPQGTLYGRSATAGVVSIHTRDPSTTLFSTEGAAEFGSYNLHHLTGSLNLPIVEGKLALRLSGNLYERDGYYTAEGDARSSTDFRAKALWTPTDTFSALVGYAQQYNVTHTGGVTIAQVSSPSDFSYTPQGVSPGKNSFHQYWAEFNLNLGPVAITYIPSYRTWYENSILYSRGVYNANQTMYTPDDSFLTQEVRIRSADTDSKLKWLVGFLYYDNNLSNMNNAYNLTTESYEYKSDTHKSTIALGGFAEATYAFAPETRLTAGLRYDHTQIRNTGSYTSINGETKSLVGDEGLRKFNNVTYKVRLEHDLTQQNLLYAMISTGFSPGDITLTTNADHKPEAQELKAETLTAYEIGSKNRFLDNRLQVNASVFYYDYQGYQTAGINTSPDTATAPTFNTISSPMKSFGGELEVQARPWKNGTVSFNASYTHARYGGFGQYQYLFSKKDVPGVAPFQGSVSYDHRIPIGSAALLLRGAVRFFTAHDTSAISEAWAALGAEPYIRVHGQAIGDINATLLFGSHYSITAYVRNIADNRFLPDGWTLANVVPGQVTASGTALSDPRTFGLTLGLRY